MHRNVIASYDNTKPSNNQTEAKFAQCVSALSRIKPIDSILLQPHRY